MRHAVGEYSEDEWQRINDQSGELLGRLRGELRGVGDEIARLAEVQGLIGGAPKRVEPPPPAPPRRRRRSRRSPSPNPSPSDSRPRQPFPSRRPVPRPSRRRGRPRSRTAHHRWTRWRSSSPWRRKRNESRRRPQAAGEAIPARRVRGRRRARAPRARRPHRGNRAPRAEPKRSSAGNAVRSIGRPSGTANAVARSSPASESAAIYHYDEVSYWRTDKVISSCGCSVHATKKGPAMAGPSSLERRASSGYFLPPALASFESRLFCRAAALGWISRLRPARSISFTASS